MVLILMFPGWILTSGSAFQLLEPIHTEKIDLGCTIPVSTAVGAVPITVEP